MPVYGAQGGTQGLSPLYMGQAATRCLVPLAQDSTLLWLMSRSSHRATTAISNPTVVFANFRVTSANVETTLGAGTIKSAIEYPAGIFTLANECIAASNGPVAFAIGLTSLTFNVTIPRGAVFWVRALQQNANGTVYRGGSTNQFPAGDGIQFGTTSGGVQDKVTSGTVADSSGARANGYTPIAILSQIRSPSFLLVGTSRTAASSSDAINDASLDIGETARLIGQRFGYINIGIGSSTLATYNSASRTYRDQMAQYVSHVLNEYGVNDLNSVTDTALATLRSTCAGFYPGKVWGTTLTPNTTSTDSFATTTNQTITTAGAKVVTFNDLVRAGISGEVGYLDIADAIDPYRAGKWPVSRNPADVSGAAGYGTADGLHGSAAAHGLIRDRGAGVLSKIVR